MRIVMKMSRWFVPGGVCLALGGCASQQQLFDFLRTEFARVTADMLGQTISLVTQATT